MLRTMFLLLLGSLTAPAFAVYKCESNGTVTYSDQHCPGGKVLDTGSAPATGDTARQNAENKAQLKRLEHERHKREAQEEKEQQRAAHAAAAKQKKCSLLARRSKWANEDAPAATGKAREKTKLKARRVAEQFEAECKT